jgi:hypothetical protein
LLLLLLLLPLLLLLLLRTSCLEVALLPATATCCHLLLSNY